MQRAFKEIRRHVDQKLLQETGEIVMKDLYRQILRGVNEQNDHTTLRKFRTTLYEDLGVPYVGIERKGDFDEDPRSVLFVGVTQFNGLQRALRLAPPAIVHLSVQNMNGETRAFEWYSIFVSGKVDYKNAQKRRGELMWPDDSKHLAIIREAVETAFRR